ncbi:PI-PLC X domain-containing protein 2 [Desmophyllum pertusum]|uniref:PI-PLC X domain-containing protein 2 n=1 Tax=Desmophyllum pertusum TaxID=174260 RepID=A0A9W9ZAQ5_9CNID|nr:PI-PLC X domain-containing protein 2 [Desmophyllum pertusum]
MKDLVRTSAFPVHPLELSSQNNMAENKVGDNDIDYSRWMENLPNEKQLIPLTDLVIPGSHDSGTFSLDKNTEIGPDEPCLIRTLGRCCGCCGSGGCVKSVVHNWSVTQSKTIYEQLTSGIRYLDLRVAYRSKDKKIHLLHGLYGWTVQRVLDDVNRFVAENPKEIVILDFNHFYNMDAATRHKTLADMLIAKFGKSLRAPRGDDGPKATLQEMWGKAETIIVIYHNTDVVNAHPSFWSAQFISSPWPNTADVNTLMDYLKEHSAASSVSDDAFHVTQAILTPQTKTIIKNICSTLKDVCARPCNRRVTAWLKTLIETKYKFNIIIADFVEIEEFIPTVIRLNSK